MKKIADIEFGQCKWPVSEELPAQIALCKDMPFAPHLFCGEPVADPTDVNCVYCASHLRRAYGGAGKDWHSLEVMLKSVEKNVVYVNPENTTDQTQAIDETFQTKFKEGDVRRERVSFVGRRG